VPFEKILGYIYWEILGDIGRNWDILGDFGRYWEILGDIFVEGEV
jgi:hypothetical protein